ncbi:prolipoprotein diacylglyceryl transferase [Rhizosphaericola mali]|uniref:Prolipoprotein diacylglyceryl transferase n=1 Tax=Rhizosphaericola mali TaxID=2545455 RepID=A0A5P2GAK3_9BACT|nr:prolipoprotein diacylglyceryl transferase family protein [Rhizosphaericola mali]QES90730.1 prolipoprotein diacylglyceryl transferase [Rhizosphaericola mali]
MQINFPVHITIAGHFMALHNLMETLGIFIAMRYYYFLKKRNVQVELSSTHSLVVLIGATAGAYLGAHLWGSLENIPAWKSSPNPINYFLHNMTIVGGLLGGLIGVELAKLTIHEKSKTGDLFTYPLLLALIIGRIGCFSAGIYEETYGIPTTLPWGMDLGDGLHRHPVNLYEIIYLIFCWIFIFQIQKKYNLDNGATFKIFMILYLVFRFLLDFIKPGWRYFFGLGSIQIACLLGLLYYYRYIFDFRKLLRSPNYSLT